MSELKPYPKYKDSGVEWIGEIPEHWSVKPLFTILEEVKNKNKELKVSNVLSLSYGKITKRDIEKNYGLLPANFRNYNIVNPGYIVMRLTDLQNDKRSLRVGYVKERGVITSAYVTLSLKKRHDYYNRYLYFLLHIYDIKKIYYGLGDGVRQTMNFNDLKWLPILEYNNEETIKIALYLDSKVSHINSLIHNKKRLIELLEEKRQAIITETVTKGLNPNVEMKDSGIDWIGEIPEHWEEIKLKYATNLRNTKTEENLPYLGLENVTSQSGKIVNFNNDNEIRGSNLRFYENDILFGKLRPYLAKCVIAPTEGRCSSEFLVLVVHKSTLDNNYLKYLMLNNKFIEKVNSSTYGARMPRANWDFIKNIKIPLPSLQEQKKIANSIENIHEEIDLLIKKINIQISKLKEYRESLIYEAVTGKIDLRNYEPKGDIDEAH